MAATVLIGPKDIMPPCLHAKERRAATDLSSRTFDVTLVLISFSMTLETLHRESSLGMTTIGYGMMKVIICT